MGAGALWRHELPPATVPGPWPRHALLRAAPHGSLCVPQPPFVQTALALRASVERVRLYSSYELALRARVTESDGGYTFLQGEIKLLDSACQLLELERCHYILNVIIIYARTRRHHCLPC